MVGLGLGLHFYPSTIWGMLTIFHKICIITLSSFMFCTQKAAPGCMGGSVHIQCVTIIAGLFPFTANVARFLTRWC